MYAIIPAGGSGSRLWPLSRSKFPKHLLDLTGDGSMIQQTISRIQPLIDPEQILVITEQGHAAQLQDQLPELPPANIIIETDRRDTAPVIGLGTFVALKRDPDAIVASLHADHVIAKTDEFLKILIAAEQVATTHDVVVTLGIHPTHPATGYGYIASGAEFAHHEDTEVFYVQGFTEKPNLPTAQAFLASGNYFWNAGMFIAKASVLLKAYEKYAPETYAGLAKIAEHIGTEKEGKALQDIYSTLPKTPIDTAIMEKIDNIVVIPADIGWSDIGSWQTVKEILPPNQSSNLVKGEHIGLETSDSLIYSHADRLIATIGLDKMIVIDTDDVTLVCPLDRAEDLKKLVNKIRKEKDLKFL